MLRGLRGPETWEARRDGPRGAAAEALEPEGPRARVLTSQPHLSCRASWAAGLAGLRAGGLE